MERRLYYLCYNIRVYCTRALRSLVQEKYNSIRIVLHEHGTGGTRDLKEVVGRRRTGIKIVCCSPYLQNLVRRTCKTSIFATVNENAAILVPTLARP